MMKKLITCLYALLCTTALSFAGTQTHVVQADGTSFVPDVVDAYPGDTIRWEYVSGYPHTVTSGDDCVADGQFDSPLSGNEGETVFEWEVPCDAPDSIPYFCDPHCGMGMKGVINVYGETDRLNFGIVDISDVYLVEFHAWVDKKSPEDLNNYFFVNTGDGSFAIGIEAEGGDIDIEVLSAYDAYQYDPDTSSSTSISAGTLTVSCGERFLLYGEANSILVMQWVEVEDEFEDSGEMTDIDGGGGVSIHSSSPDGGISFRVGETGGALEVTFDGGDDGAELQVVRVGNVTSDPTVDLPDDGEEGVLTLPAGEHDINLLGPVAWLIVDGGDDGDGGGGDNGLPEDINGDGVVDVADLLLIIAAWGATSP